jgi:hypothetical protein
VKWFHVTPLDAVSIIFNANNLLLLAFRARLWTRFATLFGARFRARFVTWLRARFRSPASFLSTINSPIVILSCYST